MSVPEYLICLECETPCYTFEWGEEGAEQILCESCGNDDPEQFVSEEEFEALSSGDQ
jgi:hypothetical protein